ncbi:STAS-like domain-containing protein [Dysgonomonas sp. 25]|uniref:STAS-like domain-containing protein n=1 Tax=Dysgonomonas sp. 25 TaxID=2302933 RepID=UPI0013D621F7|nr:DUF4325 domain-containing protein [Dysgonomonas sp. 25]NDV68573.1 hypothetical protein [Dysgonomonas sp. 25]
MKIATILKSNLAITHKQGEKIRDRIIKKLYHGKRVTVDCGGLIAMTTQFLKPICEIVLLYSQDFLNENVRFTNIRKINALLLEHCIDNILKTKEDDK